MRRHKVDRNTPRIDDLREQLFRLVGVDLTRIDGLNPHSVYYDVQYRKRVLANRRRRADQLGFDLIERTA